MKKIFYYLTILLLFVLQLALADLQVFPSTPNLLLVFLCVSLLFLRLSDILYAAVFSGLLLDLFSGLPDGVLLVSLTAGMYGAQYFGQMIFTEKLNDYMVLFYILFATIIFTMSVVVMNSLLQALNLSEIRFEASYLFSYKLGVDIIFNLLALYPVYWAHQGQSKIQKHFNPKYESI